MQVSPVPPGTGVTGQLTTLPKTKTSYPVMGPLPVSAGGSKFSVAGANPASPPGYTFPHGLFSFSASGCKPGSTLTLRMKLPSAPPAGASYWKWGPTPDNRTPHWYQLPAVIDGDTVTFSITDGGLGDDDLTTNGTIVDPGGLAVRAAGAADGIAAVPTLNEWALMLLGLLAAGLGAGQLRCRAE